MDIALRLNKEMLVLSGSIEAGLARLDVDVEHDLAIANVLEPETIKTAISPYVMGGVQCLVANTKGMLQAKLAQSNLDDRSEDVARAAIEIAKGCKPEHIIVELGNCGLPLDSESKNSLNEFKNQYVQAGRLFDEIGNFDAYMLTGLENSTQIKCALMGLRQASDKPVFVSVQVDANGKLNSKEDIYDYAQILVEFGATVAGIEVHDDLATAEKLIKRLRAGCDLPILVEFYVDGGKDKPYYSADEMKDAALMANKAGAQFLRATGDGRPAHAAVLAGTSAQMPLNIKIGV